MRREWDRWVLAVNRDGAMDIVTATNRRTFVFYGKPAAKAKARK